MNSRFNKAVTKLYKAYWSGRLKAMHCTFCAVGNICGENGDWADVVHLGVYKSSKEENLRGQKVIKNTGYSKEELAEIEKIFLDSTVNTEEGETKETQMNGLLKVIEYLANLDNIKPFSLLEEFRNNKKLTY